MKKFVLYITLSIAFFSILVVQIALAQNLKEYENANAGIKLLYPFNWDKPYDDVSRGESCSVYDDLVCMISWINVDTMSPLSMWEFTIRVGSLDNPKFMEWCDCNNLNGFMQHSYELAQFNADSLDNKLTFNNDNQTIVGIKNHSAWQMEYSKSDNDGSDSKNLNIFTKINNTFYKFWFISSGENDFYSKELPRVRELINSIEFLPIQKPIIKTPSFLNTSQTAHPDFRKSDQANSTIRILSNSHYVDSIGSMHIVGEIRNDSPSTTEYVKVVATFYDLNSQVVGTEFAYTDPSTIRSGDTVPFEVILRSASIPIEKIDSYKLNLSIE